MKKMILVAFATLFSLTVLADDYSLYVVQGETQSTFALSDLQKITFSGGNVVIATKTGATSRVPISNITRMYFDLSGETGIVGTATKRGIAWDGQSLSFNGIAGQVEVFQSSGVLVKRMNTADGASLSLSNLPSGVYIVKVGGQRLKIAKK